MLGRLAIAGAGWPSPAVCLMFPAGVRAFDAICVADFLPAAGFFDPATCWFALAGESTLETVVVLQPLVNMLPAPRQTTPAPAIQPSFRRRSVDPIMTLLPSWNRAYGKA